MDLGFLEVGSGVFFMTLNSNESLTVIAIKSCVD
jgi:hypothetical protein